MNIDYFKKYLKYKIKYFQLLKELEGGKGNEANRALHTKSQHHQDHKSQHHQDHKSQHHQDHKPQHHQDHKSQQHQNNQQQSDYNEKKHRERQEQKEKKREYYEQKQRERQERKEKQHEHHEEKQRERQEQLEQQQIRHDQKLELNKIKHQNRLEQIDHLKNLATTHEPEYIVQDQLQNNNTNIAENIMNNKHRILYDANGNPVIIEN